MTAYSSGFPVELDLRALRAAVALALRTRSRLRGDTGKSAALVQPRSAAEPLPGWSTDAVPAAAAPLGAGPADVGPGDAGLVEALPGVAGPGDVAPGDLGAGGREPAETDGGGDPTWRLVAAAQAGDAGAFGALYDRYVDQVFRFAYYRLGDRTLAEDVTSETFLRALRRIGSLTYRGRDAGAWFITIARNLVFDHLKSGRHRFEVVTDDLPDRHQTADGPEPTVLREITNAELLRCVRKLGAEQQECIVLRFLQGLSVAETAQVMGKNEGSIKALQHRAVRRLAALLPEGL